MSTRPALSRAFSFHALHLPNRRVNYSGHSELGVSIYLFKDAARVRDFFDGPVIAALAKDLACKTAIRVVPVDRELSGDPRGNGTFVIAACLASGPSEPEEIRGGPCNRSSFEWCLERVVEDLVSQGSS